MNKIGYIREFYLERKLNKSEKRKANAVLTWKQRLEDFSNESQQHRRVDALESFIMSQMVLLVPISIICCYYLLSKLVIYLQCLVKN